MLLLDVEKAFNSVWHDALLHKLIQGCCNIFLAPIIHSFLSGSTFQVSVGKSKSYVCNILYGVPQGAVLSPIFYNLFTSDASTADWCELATFADDTAIFVSNSKPMNVWRWAPIATQLIFELLQTMEDKIEVIGAGRKPIIM
jgi:hypothetical protein